MNLGAGDRLGKYLIAGTLGRGAMGTVYDARDPVIDRRVAIKTISLVPADDGPDDQEGGETLARFKREAQAAGRLHHPNIVGIYDYGETDAIAYIIMEFVEGRSLKAPLDAHERFAPAETVRIVENILAGLHYSHERGVVHRDIKPANIMLTKDGAVKIADFGIARIESSQMTQAGTIMGTPAYMSPEQFMGQTVDARSDIYSTGVLLYQLLTGERPFDGGMSAIMHKALHTDPPAPSAISVVAPTGLDAVVARAMAKRPEHRYQTAQDFAAAIRTALTTPAAPRAPNMPGETDEATIVFAPTGTGAADGAAKPGKTSRPASRAPLLAGVAVGLLILASAVAFYVSRPRTQQTPQAILPPPPLLPARKTVATAPPPALPDSVQHNPRSADPARLQTLADTLSRSVCSLATAGISDGEITVSGLVSKSGEPALRAAIGNTEPSIVWKTAVFDGPYCSVLDTVRPHVDATSGPDGLTLGLQGAPPYLALRQLLKPEMVMPAHAAYLTVDYFSNDGGLTHIAPIGHARSTAFVARASVVLGADPKIMLYPVYPPFGTDLLLAITSTRPLFSIPRPDKDTVRTYLPALERALSMATKLGGKIEARAILVETRAK